MLNKLNYSQQAKILFLTNARRKLELPSACTHKRERTSTFRVGPSRYTHMFKLETKWNILSFEAYNCIFIEHRLFPSMSLSCTTRGMGAFAMDGDNTFINSRSLLCGDSPTCGSGP